MGEGGPPGRLGIGFCPGAPVCPRGGEPRLPEVVTEEELTPGEEGDPGLVRGGVNDAGTGDDGLVLPPLTVPAITGFGALMGRDAIPNGEVTCTI